MGESLPISRKAWIAYLSKLKEQKYRVLIFSLVALSFALWIVNTHQIWAWTPVAFISLVGWMMLLKYGLSLLFPTLWPSKFFPTTKKGMEKYLKISGIIVTIIGVILVYYTYFEVADVYGHMLIYMPEMQFQWR